MPENEQETQTPQEPTPAAAGYDPDDAPEMPRSFVGRLTTALYVENQAQATAAGENIGESYRRYIEKTGRESPCWFLQAEGVSVKRTDGQPFLQGDILSLTGKDGRWLGKGMPPDVLAAAYREHGLSASYVKVGQPDSAVGRLFLFEETERQFGPFAKRFRLWPATAFPEGYVYDGEVREVTPQTPDAEGAPAQASANALPETEAVAVLSSILVGKTPDEAFDAIMASTELKATGTVLGIALLEAATEGTLTDVLAENGVLAVGDDGRYAVPTETPAA